jgi:hypothetical protein
LARKKSQRSRGRIPTGVRELSMTRLRNPKLRLKFHSHTREEEVSKGDNMVEGIIFLEEEEEVEEEK